MDELVLINIVLNCKDMSGLVQMDRYSLGAS